MTIIERKEREKQERYREILSAAEIIFARDGYSATTMDTIAEEAELSKGTLYLYFKNKEQLFFSILENKIDIYTEKLKQVLSGVSSLNELIEHLVNNQFNFLSENKYFFKLAISEQCKIDQIPTSNLREKYIDKQLKLYTLVEEALRKFIPITAEYSAKTLTLSLIGAINSYMMNWLLSGQEEISPDIKHEIVSLFYHGVN